MIIDSIHQKALNSSVRKIGMEVSLFFEDTLLQVFTPTDALKSVKVERLGESKFFGFGIGQKVNVKLVDAEGQIKINTDHSLVIQYDVGGNLVSPYPVFYVSEVHRDENTNELSITAYDALYEASHITVQNLDVFKANYTLKIFGESCARILGLGLEIKQVAPISVFDTDYPTGANFEGTESVRDALDDLAEATQTFYYISGKKLVFKRIQPSPVLTIDKELYFKLNSGSNRRLSKIVSATELGNNLEVSTGISGTTQYVRDNAFWTLRDDIETLLNNAIHAIGNCTIAQFNCSWRGNYLLELGDCIQLTGKNNDILTAFLFNDTIDYNGALTEQTKWEYVDDDETANNPIGLGDVMKQTFARVDKVNKQIDIVASDVKSNSEAISQLRLTDNNISASVSSLKNDLDNSVDGINQDIIAVKKSVEAAMTSEQVEIAIKKELENGVDKVETSTGFVFDQDGLRVSKNTSEMETQITEDGMSISRSGAGVLTANNEGVRAEDLQATTYLIIGNNSRLEDYKNNRTGCFWIGG